MIETKLNNLEINELTEEQYKNTKEAELLNSNAFYITPSTESVSDIVPINKGGTNANMASDARINLGFEYGEEIPTNIPSTGDGAIYFKIDDADNDILPFEEGGTGAVTGYDALRNLGAVDYVVEQGISGIWTYRKWNSGIAECWGRVGSKSYAMTAPSGYGYYYTGDTSINLPTGLFTKIDMATSDRCGGTTANGLITTNVRQITTTKLSYFIWDTATSTSDVDVALNVKGTWK